MLGKDMLGTVCIQRSLRGIWSEQVRYLSLLGAIVLAASLVALLMVWRLEQFITRPILNLIETAKAVSADKDYGLRATPHTDDELGQLVRCFNEMLMEIQQRDLVLQAHRDRLEDLVALRTEELVEVNRDLTKARDQAERASDAKSAFLANMSHEIRTPMTAILGYSDLLVEQRQSPSDQRDAFQVIRRNARHLLDLINDILDISKIEAGKMNVERIPVDLPSLIGEVVSIMRPRAIDKGLEMHVEFSGEIPRCIQCDPLRLKQILVNLIGNAVKFTQNGNITLFTRCEALANDSRLVFEIRDTGIGMTGEQMGRLFQPFGQADESTTRKFGGTGLGLAISQRLTRLLGGEVSVSSRPGEGSTFTVVIAGGSLAGVEMLRDLRESMLISTAPEPAPRNVTLNAKILLIEDGFDNQQLISTHLRKAGAEVTIAENGRIGLEKAMAQRFDLILMDMQMPEMDGQTATGELRRRGVGVPIIALTAHAMAEDRARCLAAGCTDYLSKPVRKDVLLNTVGGYLDGRRAYFNADAPALAPSLGRLRSSLASDPDMRDVLKGFVENLPKRVQRLMDLTQKRDLEQLREVLHQLKGAGGGYGFAEITRRAACAEKAIKAQAAIGNITLNRD